ncbi:MAG: precorrin-6y C5,15-methyltransferase (decarboxylating) subunit CbiE [Smithella sp.]
MAMKTNPIRIVGCGPGSLEYVTPLAYKIVHEADVLVGAQRLLDLFPQTAAQRVPVSSQIEGLLDQLEKISPARRIVILVTGDPGLLSLARLVIARFGRDACRVIAGVSSLQVAFAALGLDWHDALVIDAHGDLPQLDDASIANAGKIAVYAGKKESFKWMAGLARLLGMEYRIFLCADLTLPGETVREITEDNLLEEGHPSLSVVIFVKKELME